MGFNKRIAPTRVKALEQVAENSARGQLILQDLLTELATILVPRGVTPVKFNEMARQAFAHAAADMSRLRNGRVNQSRVAVLTGLRRAEVRKLLTCAPPASNVAGQSLVELVIQGWCTDKRFIDSRGDPKRLPITGGGLSFASLVKSYGGDVPHRAMLDELRCIGIVTLGGNQVEVRKLSLLRRRRNFASLAHLLPFLVNGIRLASNFRVHPGSPSIHRITLPVHNVLDLAMVRERCTSSITSMLGGLRDSLGAHITVPRRNNKMRHSCTITVMLSENKIPSRGDVNARFQLKLLRSRAGNVG